MYEQLFSTASDTLSRAGTAYNDAGRSADLGFYYLMLHEATLATFREETPPAGNEGLHQAFVAWVEAGRDLLVARLEGRAVPEAPYDDAAVGLMEQLAALSATATAEQAAR